VKEMEKAGTRLVSAKSGKPEKCDLAVVLGVDILNQFGP
jgi:hypothetical protein